MRFWAGLLLLAGGALLIWNAVATGSWFQTKLISGIVSCAIGVICWFSYASPEIAEGLADIGESIGDACDCIGG